MGSSYKSSIAGFVKKPFVRIAGVIFFVILLFMIFFGRGGGQDPTAVAVKNLSNQHTALVDLIDDYSGEVRSATLRANLSQVSIILTADKNDIDSYYQTAFNASARKKTKSTVSTKPKKALIEQLDNSKLLNNLDSELESTVKSELDNILVAINKLKKENLDKQKLQTLSQKLILNTQTVSERVSEAI